MDKFIGLLKRLTVTTLFVLCAIAGRTVLANAPVLDLDADDSSVVGVGYFTVSNQMNPTPTITNDVLITDSDDNKIARAIITIINPEPGDRLIQKGLKGQLTYDPSSTDTQLIVTGKGLLKKYETALGSITFSNNLQNRERGLRFIKVIVEDVSGQFSNTAVTAISVQSLGGGGGQAFIRGYIYATIKNAVNSVNITGAIVSINTSDFPNPEMFVYESAGLYILDIYPANIAYTVHANLPGYEANSIDNVIASKSNDPSNPIQLYLSTSGADADVVPDGQLNAGDFLIATRIVLGLKSATAEELSHGDMNSDGQFTLSDLILILQAIQAAS